MMPNEEKVLMSRTNKMAIAWFINELAYSIVYPFIPLYLHNSRGFTMATVSWIFPLMGIGAILGPVVAGPLVDLWGRRKILIFGPIIRGFLFFLLAFLVYKDSLFSSFAIVLMLNTFFGSFFQNASDAYLTDLTPLNKRAKVYSRIRVGSNVGWAVGPMLGAFLARSPFSLLFALTGVLCISGAAFTAYTCVEIKPSDSQVKTIGLSAGIKHDIWDVFKNYQFLFFGFFYFVIMMLVSQLYSTMSVYSAQVVGVSRNMLGIVYSINGATVVLLQIPLTKYLDKSGCNLYPRMIIGATLYGIGYFVLGVATSAVFLMAIVVIVTLGEIILNPAAYALVRACPKIAYFSKRWLPRRTSVALRLVFCLQSLVPCTNTPKSPISGRTGIPALPAVRVGRRKVVVFSGGLRCKQLSSLPHSHYCEFPEVVREYAPLNSSVSILEPLAA